MASTHSASSSSTRRGCHLCESARRVIEQVRAEMPFELVETDISGDDELEARYRERLPVVIVDGEEAFTYFVHPDGLAPPAGSLRAAAQTRAISRRWEAFPLSACGFRVWVCCVTSDGVGGRTRRRRQTGTATG